MTQLPLVVAVTGASGACYASNLLGHLARLGVAVDLVVSPAAVTVLRHEVDAARAWMEGDLPILADFGLAGHPEARAFGHADFMAPVASGTALTAGIVIVPSSMGTIGRIAAGISSNLIERAADVALKERRRLVLVPREAPLSAIHLENMLKLTRAGAVVLPATPGFYHGPTTMDQLLDHVSAKILDVLGIEHDVIERWGAAP